tara:strand:+ start:84 stop:620 length:537 start_codon:yes stop_codon:yes gene_type:complete
MVKYSKKKAPKNQLSKQLVKRSSKRLGKQLGKQLGKRLSKRSSKIMKKNKVRKTRCKRGGMTKTDAQGLVRHKDDKTSPAPPFYGPPRPQPHRHFSYDYKLKALLDKGDELYKVLKIKQPDDSINQKFPLLVNDVIRNFGRRDRYLYTGVLELRGDGSTPKTFFDFNAQDGNFFQKLQ